VNKDKENKYNIFTFREAALLVSLIICVVLVYVCSFAVNKKNIGSDDSEEKFDRSVDVECRFHNYEVVEKYGLAFFCFHKEEKENAAEIIAGILIYPDGQSPNLFAHLYRPGKYTVIYKAGNDRWPSIKFEVKDADHDYILDIDCITGDLQLTQSDSLLLDDPAESPGAEGTSC